MSSVAVDLTDSMNGRDKIGMHNVDGKTEGKQPLRRLDGDLKIILICILVNEVVRMERGFGSCSMTERISVLVLFKT
jgi:hypothetical protein